MRKNKEMKMEATASSSQLETSSSLFSDRRRAIEELIKGRDSALQLRSLFPNLKKDDGLSSQVIFSQDLIANILSSFANSLSILKNGEVDEVSPVEAHTHLRSPCWEAYLKTEEDSGESCKSSTVKDRRGRYKRRRCVDSWSQNSSTLIDDGLAWRKYGQKEILNAKFPRNYFRCTHKFDQGCQATKQVQRIMEEPPLFRTTYIGQHTCKNLIKASQLILDSTGNENHQSPMISFNGTHIPEKDFNPFFSPSSFQSIKEESKDIDHQAPSCMTQIQNQSSSSTSSDEYLVSPEFTAFESTCGHLAMFSSDHHGDVLSSRVNSSSCTAGDYNLDISVDFGDVLEFEF